MSVLISTLTIDLLLKLSNTVINKTESNIDKIKKLTENGLLLPNVTYQVIETNEIINPIKTVTNKIDDDDDSDDDDSDDDDDDDSDDSDDDDSDDDDSDDDDSDDDDQMKQKQTKRNCGSCSDDSDDDD